MMRWLIDIPIRRKLLLITVLASGVALLLAGSIIVGYEIFTYREQKAQEIAVQAQILGASVTASLEFADPKTAQENLDALRANPDFSAAGVYTSSGALFASYVRPGGPSRPLPARAEPPAQRFVSDELVTFWPVRQGARQVGSVYLRMSTEPLVLRLARYGGIILLVMVGSLLITLPVSARLHSMIANPIREIADAARRVAAGEIVIPTVTYHRADEIGRLEQSFVAMSVSLGEMNREIGDGVAVLATATSAILSGTSQVAAGAAEAATVISQTAVTLDEVKQTALVSSQKAKYVSEAAQKASQVSQTGRRAVEESIDGMQQIREQMEMIAESIVRLSEQTQAIGEIIASVNDLAEQSNLLAVNASIEAAKAGEHGKGFAVVAQEVKSLAAQSRQATAQVRTILGDIQKATSNAVLAAEQGTRAVDAGARQTKEAGEAIQRLADSIAESASAASQIAVSAQQQFAGMDQLAMAMDNIKTATAQNLDSTRQAEAAAHRLHELGQKLKGVVGRYSVGSAT
jgi:methyl-accepting chemotaxis protein